MERMLWLIKVLNEAALAYYQQDREIVSDMEYDRLMDELIELEKKYGTVMSNSPSKKVGHTVVGGLAKIRHEYPMLSLDKTKELDKLKIFLSGHDERDLEGLLSWKLDGLAIAIKYEDGQLTQAVTRGNGEIGEDVTHNARVFKNIPLRIAAGGSLLVRGEAVIGYKAFEKINEDLGGLERYKNPRNLCSGSVRQLNSEIAARRDILFFAYAVVRADYTDFDDKKSNQLKWLRGLGFHPVEHMVVHVRDIDDAVAFFQSKVLDNDFASDGLVLTYNSISYSESLGATTKFPRHSLAFKWKDEQKETILRGVQWNTSRTGLINPVALFDPVEIEGSTVNKASLHNVSILRGLEIGVGDRVLVYKANMIIPQIAKNLTRSNGMDIPDNCPVCGGISEIVKLRDGEALYCTNPNCSAQLVRSLTHYASRDAMNIEGFSVSTIEKFVERGYLNNYTDIYQLWRHGEDIVEMDGFGEKSYQNLMNAIERSKEADMANFIYALGINHVGLSNARLLCKYFDYNMENIINARPEELMEVDGFGKVIAGSVCAYLGDEKNLSLLNKALSVIQIKEPKKNDISGANLHNKSFVITGDLSIFGNRRKLKELIESRGGKVTGSVTGNTDYLINNDRASVSAKSRKAKELGVDIITEDDLAKLLQL